MSLEDERREEIVVDEVLSSLRMHDCPEDEEAAAREWEKETQEHMARIRKLEREENLQAIVDGEYDIRFAVPSNTPSRRPAGNGGSPRGGVCRRRRLRSSHGVIGLSSIERGTYPDSSDHWDWEGVYPTFGEEGFDWEPGVRERLRGLVVDCGLATELPDEWNLEDVRL